MSYILDALKKSEHERQQNQSPTVHSIHASSRLMIERKSSPAGKWILVLSLLVIGGFLTLKFFNPSLITPLSATLLSSNSKPAKEQEIKVTANKSVVTEQALNKTETPGRAPLVKSSENPASDPSSGLVTKQSVVISEDDLPVMQLIELPDAVRTSLPAMTYSFHVFSADKSKRTIIINNRRYREGEQVGNNWMLDSITETGIVLRQGRYRAAIDVVESW